MMKLFNIEIQVVILETHQALFKVSIKSNERSYSFVTYICRYLFWSYGYDRPTSGDASYVTCGDSVVPFNYSVSVTD